MQAATSPPKVAQVIYNLAHALGIIVSLDLHGAPVHCKVLLIKACQARFIRCSMNTNCCRPERPFLHRICQAHCVFVSCTGAGLAVSLCVHVSHC